MRVSLGHCRLLINSDINYRGTCLLYFRGTVLFWIQTLIIMSHCSGRMSRLVKSSLDKVILIAMEICDHLDDE